MQVLCGLQGIFLLFNCQTPELEDILGKMDFNKEYKTSEIAKFIDVKETRARTLLKELVKQGKIKAIGKNKGRRYIRK